MTPIHFGKKLRYLVPREFESRLLGSKVYTKEAGGWSASAKKSGVFFDLSRIEWVELGAVVQLVLLIESALREGVAVTVALPLPKARRSEKVWMQANPKYAWAVQNRIKYRKVVLDFLTHLRFQQALKADHLESTLSNLHILDDYDPGISKPIEEDVGNCLQEEQKQRGSNELQEPERLYRFCFPLCWISLHEQPAPIRRLAKFIADVASSIDETHHGIEVIDADTIANVILYEIVGNVANHAGKKASWALVAARLRPDNKPLHPENNLNSVHPYIHWLTQKQTSIVEIVIGDSGDGIKKTLEESFHRTELSKENNLKDAYNETAAIMLWAFDRWSTSKEDRKSLRGTRGLYRIDRIVKKYQGIITLRSENQLVGIDHGGPSYDEYIPPPNSRPQQLSYAPGTILNFWLPPFHEHILPRKISTELTKEIDFKFFDLGTINEEGINSKARKKLKQILNNDKVLVLANIKGAVASPSPKAIEETLRQAVEMRHPGALVISGLPGGRDLIENAVDSINAEHEKSYRDFEAYSSEHFEIWDPVLVIAPPNRTFWVGSTATRRNVLNKLIEKGGVLNAEHLKQLIPVEKERACILLEFRNDTSVVKIHDDESIELIVSSSNICSHIQKSLKQHVLESGSGVKAEGIYQSPSLYLMKKWLNVEKILISVTNGSGLAMFALSERIREHDAWKQKGPSDFIIYDSSSNLDNINLLQYWLDIKPKHKEVIAGERGVHIFNSCPLINANSRVIIYSDQIISNKSAKRCLQQVLRDNATPVVAACLFDLRKEPKEDVEVWGITVPVISLSRIALIEDLAKPREKITNINPITRKEEKYQTTSDKNVRYKIKQTDLIRLLEKHNAIHFSHIGRPIGRHFTFYIGSSSLIEENEIYEAFDSEINEWMGKNNNPLPRKSQKIEIWHPESEPQPFAPARRFAAIIKERRKDDIACIRQIPREPVYRRWLFSEEQTVSLRSKNVLIVDWGALTGETVMQMIRLAAETGADRILVCIFLSQLPQTEENFLRTLDSLRVPHRPEIRTPFLGQSQLWPEPLNTEQPKTQEVLKTVKVSVRFLGRFPIKAYHAENECPICQGLPRMTQNIYPTELLSDFAKNINHNLLRTRKREEVIDNDSEDFLFSSSAIRMAFFREDLVSALIFTQKRQEVFERIERLYELISINPAEPSEEVLSFLTFLSIETQWLSNPPLYFKKLRKLIANISLVVALNQNLSIDNRLAAFIVLRASSKSLFAEKFADLFTSTINSNKILMHQLLYSAFTYVVRPYHKTAKIFEPLLVGLHRVKLDYGEKFLISATTAETIDVLIARAKQECSKAGVRSYSRSQSWSKLRSIFNPQNYQSHHSVPTSIKKMKPLPYRTRDIENMINERVKNESSTQELDKILWLKQARVYWSICCDFLDNSVLPHLAHLKPILLSEIGRRIIGHEDIDKLIELIDDVMSNKKSLSESNFSRLVKAIAEKPYLILSKENRNSYIANVEWFESRLLKPREESGKQSSVMSSLQSRIKGDMFSS